MGGKINATFSKGIVVISTLISDKKSDQGTAKGHERNILLT